MMKNNRVIVKDFLGLQFAVSSEEGERLGSFIISKLNADENVTLDFAGIKLIISTFLNAAIGQLYGRYTTQFIKGHLIIENMTNDDLIVLKKVTDRAKEYFNDKNNLDKIIKKSFPDAEPD